MQYATTSAYRTRLAQFMTGEPSGPLSVAGAQLGNGAYTAADGSVKPPTEALYSPLQDPVIIPALTRSGQTVQVTLNVVAGSTPLTFDEFSLSTPDGLTLLHATMPPQVISANVEVVITVNLLPEV